MVRSLRLKLLGAIIAGFVASLAFSGPSFAEECPEAGPGLCHPDFALLTGVAEDQDRGFVAVGALRVADGEKARVGFLRLTKTGRPQSWTMVEPPSDSEGQDVSATDVFSLEDGTFMIIGRVSYSINGQANSDPMYARVNRDGETLWVRRIGNYEGQQFILYKGTLLSDGRALLVGRGQIGKGDKTCTNWSRGVLFWIDRDNPDNFASLYSDYVPNANRMAFYDVEEDPSDGALTLTGFESVWSPDGSTCQDEMLVMRTKADGALIGNSWGRFGFPESNEIGLGIEKGGDPSTGLVVVGLSGAGDRAAMVARFRWTDEGGDHAADVNPTYFPVGSGGFDRFRTALRLPDSENTLIAGYSSDSQSARHQAWWKTLDANLMPLDEDANVDHGGSSVRAMAISPDGTVLAVGHVWPTDAESSQRLGWSHILRLGQSFEVSTREPDPSLPSLEVSVGQGDIGLIADQEMAFALPSLAEADRVSVRFSVDSDAPVRMAIQPFGGDADLALVAENGRLIDFSSHADEAGEFVEVALSPGIYNAVITAISEVDLVEVRVSKQSAGSASQDAPVLSLVERLRFADVLDVSGYDSGGSPDLGVGATMSRSMKAAAISQGADLTAPFDRDAADALLSGTP